MKNPILFLLMAASMSLLFTNCQKDTDIPDEGMLNVPFNIDFEFQTQVTDDLSVTFESVTEDSRCPCDAECIWAGEIGVKIKMQANGTTLSKLFTLDGYEGDSGGVLEMDFEGYNIELLDVLPYPCNGQPDSNNDYEIKVLVTRN